MKKLMNIIGSATLLGFATWGLATESALKEPTAQVQKHKEGVVWIDVRTAGEFEQGHLSHAINIPYEQVGEKIAQVATNKNTPIHLYCHSGRRAEVALNTLKNMGYTQVFNEGAYIDLLKKIEK